MKPKNIKVKTALLPFSGFPMCRRKESKLAWKKSRISRCSHLKIVSADQENKVRCRTILGGCEQKITSALQENSDD